jgi:hypothetical protein
MKRLELRTKKGKTDKDTKSDLKKGDSAKNKKNI